MKPTSTGSKVAEVWFNSFANLDLDYVRGKKPLAIAGPERYLESFGKGSLKKVSNNPAYSQIFGLNKL